ncbi:hypothetical protein MKX01_005783 [Papaver californicum]|nr:hypothetical protein MKX01_005783 [Papaver californicum]
MLRSGSRGPYTYFTWVVTYGTISPPGKPSQGIPINGQFPGPRLDCITNNNVIINVINKIDKPFLLTCLHILLYTCLRPHSPNFTRHLRPSTNTPNGPVTASAARPNPQGTYHYGSEKIVTIIRLSNSEAKINGKLRYAINGMSYVNPYTPPKLADYFNVPGVFDLKSFRKKTSLGAPAKFGIPVTGALLHDFVKIFSNTENTIQSWYIADNDFWVVGYGPLKWSAAQMKHYNLVDAPKSYTIQTYPKSWTAILMPLDNKGMWNLRSQIWPRRYLGQELYVKVWNDEKNLYTVYDIPKNTLLCGKARDKHV